MRSSNFYPARVTSQEETGLPRGLLYELVLKRTFLEGTTTLQRLINETRLDYKIVEGIFRNMQQEQICDTKRMIGLDYEFALTTKGLHIAQEAFRKSQYTGPAPVTLADYCRAVSTQVFQPRVNRESLSELLSDLVLSEDTIRELGAALMTGGSLFLYGPTGSGKSSIATRLRRIFNDPVYIPHAVEISGQVLTIFEPGVHQAVEQPEDIDPRWVLCQRPFVVVGGELRYEMLEPYLDESTHTGVGPLQMRANNGILVIDDFGRQRIQPRDLLNRWIVPLDRKVDHMALRSGAQFEIPFDVLVVFATNLEVSHLAEDAFLRRIRNKIKVDAVTPSLFQQILQQVCNQRDIAWNPDSAEYLMSRCAERAPGGLRACIPRDLAEILCGVASFEQRKPRLDREDVDRAIRLYFER